MILKKIIDYLFKDYDDEFDWPEEPDVCWVKEKFPEAYLYRIPHFKMECAGDVSVIDEWSDDGDLSFISACQRHRTYWRDIYYRWPTKKGLRH